MGKGLNPDSDEAIAFLRYVYPDGPWCLTAISVDRKSIITETFTEDQHLSCKAWIDKWNGSRNVYWHVNPPIKSIRKKAEREDIKEVAYLHVDLDPRAGEELVAEQKRIHAKLMKPPGTVPKPSFIIFSGGGFQAFWKLEVPIPIDGNLDNAEDAKRYNIELEYQFGGDNCHNIDRLMRLVGTVNIPDAKKKKKGRKEIVAELVFRKPTYIYPISKFDKSQDVQLEDGASFHTGNSVAIEEGADIPRIDSVDDLNEWDVSDRVKVIIVQGRMPDERKDGDDSRSAWLFDCICQLVRAGVPDPNIFGVVTDPDLKISESVLDKGQKATKYARRQIERAHEEAINPALRELNEKHAVIADIGGKCRVIHEVPDLALKRSRLSKQAFEDFRNRYMHRQIEIGKDKDGKPTYMQMGKWWLQHPQRKQYEGITFAPGHDVPGYYNLWKGFAFETRAGNCDMFLEHTKQIVCGNNQEYFDYLMGWMASAVQRPASPGHTAIVLRGKRGTGKSFFAKTFGSLFGRHYLQIADGRHLVGNFNAHLRDCVVLFGDEAFYAGDKKHESVLKLLITEEMLAVEGKGIDVELSSNFLHIILASNERWVIPAGENERRFLMLDVLDTRAQDTDYFQQMQAELDEGGYEGLLYMLMHYDLSKFQVRNVPKTEALHEQKMLSLNTEEEWWYGKLKDGRLLPDHSKWKQEVRRGGLIDDYTEYTRRFNIARRGNETTVGRFMHRMVPGLESIQKKENVEVPTGRGDYSETRVLRPYFYRLPNLDECRKAWEELYGAEKWPVILAVEGGPMEVERNGENGETEELRSGDPF